MSAPIIQITEPPSKSDPQNIFDTKTEAMLDSLVQAIDSANEAFAALGLNHRSTSTTSNSLGIGTKTFTVSTGLGYVAGMYLNISHADNLSNHMQGVVSSYNATTGQLVVLTEESTGTGTFSNWSISVAVRPSSKQSLPYAVTTGTSSAYVVDFDGAIGELKDGQVFVVKFHTANLANATIQAVGINPAMTLRIVGSDGELINAGANDVTLNYPTLVMVVENATGALIVPARSVYTTVDISANTTLTKENCLDRTLVIKQQGTIQLLPLLSTFPEGGSFEIYCDVQLVIIQANGSDVVSLNNTDTTAFGLGAAERVEFRKHNGKWLAIRYRYPRRITHNFTSDITMPVGQVVEYAIINQTSQLLRIATSNNQRYRGTFFCTDRPTANGTTPFLLNINNTTYAGTVTPIGFFASASAASAVTSTAVGGFPLSAATTGANFSFEFEFNTSTYSKEIEVQFSSVNSGGARFTGYLRAKSSDTTTAVTSLGTIDFVVATTGILRIERIE